MQTTIFGSKLLIINLFHIIGHFGEAFNLQVVWHKLESICHVATLKRTVVELAKYLLVQNSVRSMQEPLVTDNTQTHIYVYMLERGVCVFVYLVYKYEPRAAAVL